MIEQRVRRLALPFRFEGGRAVTVEQDSEDDVLQCARAVLAFRPGHRRGSPEFGCPPQAHRQGGADLEEMADAIARWEERAEPVARDMGWDLTGLAQHVMVGVIAEDAGA